MQVNDHIKAGSHPERQKPQAGLVRMTYPDVDHLRTAALTFMVDAARHYADLADTMTALSKHKSADVFRRLVETEEELARRLFATTEISPSAGMRRWLQEGEYTLPADIAGSIYSLTPVAAINLALHINRQAIGNLTEILADATEEDGLHDLAQQIYHAISEQTACLRLQRRRLNAGQEAESGPGAGIARPVGIARDLAGYEQYRNRCLGRLAAELADIATTASTDDQAAILEAAATILAADPDADEVGTFYFAEGNAVVRSIAAVEAIFDLFLRAAEQSKDEALFRLAQADADRLLPVLRRLRRQARKYEKPERQSSG
jgi:hypothetical protein